FAALIGLFVSGLKELLAGLLTLHADQNNVHEQFDNLVLGGATEDLVPLLVQLRGAVLVVLRITSVDGLQELARTTGTLNCQRLRLHYGTALQLKVLDGVNSLRVQLISFHDRDNL